MSSITSEGKKKKKTKLDKICELESSLKIMREDNKRLKKENYSLKYKNFEEASIASLLSDGPSLTSSAGGSEEKLKEALQSLKRVTVKQENSLKTLRSKAKERRAELELKDQIVEKMHDEIEALTAAHEKLRGNSTDDVGTLRAKLADLELQLAKESVGNVEQSKKLIKSKNDISSLRGQLDNLKGNVRRGSSTASLKSADSSAASTLEDMGRLRRDVAKKTEKIANLEQDLEMARDEIYDLKRKEEFDAAFPMTPDESFPMTPDESFPMTPAPGTEDFFSEEDEEEDEFWGK
jgi:chromosome segregation ATPase